MIGLLLIPLFIWGLVCLITGKMRLPNRKVTTGAAARIAGIVAMLGLPASLITTFFLGMHAIGPNGTPDDLEKIVPKMMNTVDPIVVAVFLGATLAIGYSKSKPIPCPAPPSVQSNAPPMPPPLPRTRSDIQPPPPPPTTH